MSPAIPYFAIVATVKKRTFSPARPQEVALPDLSEGVLVAELQLCLQRGQEAIDVLAARGSCLSKLAKDFVAVEKANMHLHYQVKCLKDATLEDKAIVQTL